MAVTILGLVHNEWFYFQLHSRWDK